jgi:Tol biopolymer transport system component
MLPAGTMLGPYRIVAAIGAGGMGEVYRAHDTRLGRDVAVKVLSRSLTHDPDSLRRFEQEARAAGMLNHPNILAIYDIGTEGEQRYIVSELLEGESLRARLRENGAIPARKATDYASQLARGLAAAHERGIVHRDLKPENVFLTRDGHVKILDFGLVKLMTPRVPGGAGSADEHAPTLPTTPTEPGRLLGTVGYMAPEQVRGNPGDHRSDIFSFGAILYEMLSGRQAFRGESPIETLNAILKDDPPDFFELGLRVPAVLDRIARHCLEKNPDERFQSARDLAFDLGALSGLTSQIISSPRLRGVEWRRLWRPIAIISALTLAALGAFLVGRHYGTQPPPAFHRLTYRTGTIENARFAPDGQTVFYGARWNGMPVEIFSVRGDSPESRALGLGTADILSVSRNGQLAISLRRHPIGYLRATGVLAQVPIDGGAPRELLEDVEAADWAPDGRSLAVIRSGGGHSRLEFPIGKVLYETVGWISSPRFSPRGNALAFVDHPFLNDDRGSVMLVDLRSGARTTIGHEWQSISGLAWVPDGREIWFAGEDGASARSIRAVTLDGDSRLVAASAGALALEDIAPDGRALITRQNQRAGIMAMIDADAQPRDLSWFDFSIVRDLSADGKTIAFSESGEAGGSIYGVYVRSIDGSPAVRLGDGTTESLSPDGKWVLSIPRNRNPAQIVMLPTGPGEPRAVTHDKINHRTARWFPDGRRILFQGNAPGEASRIWVQDVAGGAPRAVTPQNVVGTQVTPDATRILGLAPNRHFYFYPVAGGAPQPVPTLQFGDVPVRFSSDGKSVFVATFGKIPALLSKVDLATGERMVWREAMPPDPAGLINVGPIFVTPDGRTTVYSYTRLLCDLFVLDRGRKH